MKNIIRAVVALLFAVLPAAAQTPTTFTLFSGIGAINYTYRAFQCAGVICSLQIPSDYNGTPLTGVAGSPSVQALTIQGIAAGQPVAVTCSTGCGQIAQGTPGATAPGTALFVGGVYNSSLPTPSTGQLEPLQLDASGRVIVNCTSGCGGSGGTSIADEAAFTFNSTSITPAGGVYQTTATSNALGTGQIGAWQMTANRAGFVNLRNASGTEIGTAATPVQVTGANGTFPATESGTWTVQPGNTPNTSPWLFTINQGGNSAAVTASNALKVDGSAVTQPVSVAAAFPLPTGAATSSLQTTGNTTLSTISTTLSSASTAALQTTGNASLATIATNTGLPIPAQSSHTVNIGATDSISPYPATAVPITASTTGTTAATTATLTNVSGHTTYICGFSIRANATSAVTGNATVTGTITGTLNYTQWTAPNASGLGVTEEVFSPCVPASAVSTSIAVISAAPGTGGVVSVTAWGYSI